MTDDASEKAVGRLAIGIDVGGSGIKAAVVDVDSRAPDLGAAQGADADAVDPGSRHRLDRPAGQAAGQVGRPRRDDPGRDRPARRDHRRRAQVRRQHRPGLDRLPGRRPAEPRSLKRPIFIINDADAAGIAEMRFGVGEGQAGEGHLPDARDRRGVRRVQRRRPGPEHRVRADGDPRPCRPSGDPPPSRGSSAGCRGRRGLPISTSTSTASSS